LQLPSDGLSVTHTAATKVAFLDQTIEIESPGGLMPNLTVEDMVQGVSVIRNPAIARVFLEMGLIEKWGTGLPRAIQALTDAGLPAPEFKELPISLRVIVRIKNHDVTPDAVRAEQLIHTDTDPGVYVYKSGVQVPASAAAILRAVLSGPASRSNLLSVVGLSQSPNNYLRHILPLVEAELLALSIPDKPRSPQQRYLITDAGRNWLESNSRGSSGNRE